MSARRQLITPFRCSQCKEPKPTMLWVDEDNQSQLRLCSDCMVKAVLDMKKEAPQQDEESWTLRADSHQLELSC